MATSSLPAPISRPVPVPTLELVVRVLLAALAVVICYQLRWDLLRFITLELNLRLDALAGVTLQRVSPDTVLWNGTTYRYVIACCFADVWCGAIPLIWDLRRTIRSNIARIVVFGIVLVAFNVFRLSVSDVLFANGIPWDFAHGIIGGLAYFAVFVWIWNRKSWRAFVATPNDRQLATEN